jgi:hypothetical protein
MEAVDAPWLQALRAEGQALAARLDAAEAAVGDLPA